jgi:hypothetical protein
MLKQGYVPVGPLALPQADRIGKCLGCGRLLISDIYSLCMRCAMQLLEAPASTGAKDESDTMYRELGGES